MSPSTGQAATVQNLSAGGRRHWQQLWRESITDAYELLNLLGLGHLAEQLLPDRDTGFATRVPRGFATRMRHGDANDPLLLQVLAQTAELKTTPGYSRDAVGDLDALAAHGILHKYHGRALLIATGSCAVNCRYCFRRHFPYASETAASGAWREAVEHLHGDTSIEEVILSGGDPLSLSTTKLSELSDALRRVTHLRRLRIHTRLPIVLPERIDDEFCDWLRNLPWPVAIVVHANHANEIDNSVVAACQRLRKTGAALLNQSVLLRRINDNVDALVELSGALFAAGIVPYYLHQLDRVEGAAHFAVDDTHAKILIQQLRNRVSGYMVPRLVREVAGKASKSPL